MITRLAIPRFPDARNPHETAFRRAVEQWCAEVVEVLRQVADGVDVMDDTTRPTPTAYDTGRMIFNTDDGQLNIWNGSDWTLPDGSVT